MSGAIQKYFELNNQLLAGMLERRDELLEQSVGVITPDIEQLERDILAIQDDAKEGIALRVLELKQNSEALKAKIKPILDALLDDLNLAENRQEWMERLLKAILVPGPDSELVTDKVAAFYQESTRTIIDDPSLIPLEFTKMQQVPDVKAIGEALKADPPMEVPGAHLEICWNLQVKPGGEKAKKNAATRKAKRHKKTIDLSTAITKEA